MDQYQYFMYRMKIPEADYFSYAIPAVLVFIIGLHIRSGNNRGEIIDQKKIKVFVSRNPLLPNWLIGIGFASGAISNFFPAEIKFVFYLLSSFKFIGLYLIILGEKNIRPLILVLVIGSIIVSSLQEAMFHDLLTWTIYTSAIFGIKYKFSFNFKLIGLSVFFVIVVIIQLMKSELRSADKNSDKSGVDRFGKVFKEKNEKGDFLNFEKLAESVVRINQGFIVSNIMNRVPETIDFANGEELYLILESAFMPRFLAPNKLTAGNRDLFVKYSGVAIKEGTSMGLSSLGDAYINFGIFGGSIFMFVLGFFYSEVLNYIHKQSYEFPILILFVCMLFFYPIRPDCEFQTILGHLIKGLILVFAILNIWKSTFKVYMPSVGRRQLAS
ncbi:MAG: hypothetical protein FGM46_09295 [Ferruginibacter sp.]|nr:hypothetical protein [Ferruginibacter sp.]